MNKLQSLVKDSVWIDTMTLLSYSMYIIITLSLFSDIQGPAAQLATSAAEIRALGTPLFDSAGVYGLTVRHSWWRLGCSLRKFTILSFFHEISVSNSSR